MGLVVLAHLVTLKEAALHLILIDAHYCPLMKMTGVPLLMERKRRDME